MATTFGCRSKNMSESYPEMRHLCIELLRELVETLAQAHLVVPLSELTDSRYLTARHRLELWD